MSLDRRERSARLAFPTASVAVHLLLSDVPAPATAAQDRFTYHQHEFVSYAHRDDPPFGVQSLEPPAGLAAVTCRMPLVAYERAGRRHVLLPRSTGLELATTASLAHFQTSGLAVLHVILTSPDAETTTPGIPRLSEYDVIRIAKLWEGGEGAPAALARAGGLKPIGAPWARFESEGSDQDLASLVEAVRRERLPDSKVLLRPARGSEAPDRPYLTGSLQLRTSPATLRSLVTCLHQLEDPAPRDPGEPEEDMSRLLALSGVLRALMAFDDTYLAELPSIFRQTTADRRLITTVHKGTFLRIAADMRMPSAYFLLPHSIALHNEALLDRAVHAGEARLRVEPRAADRETRPVSTQALESTRRQVHRWLEQQVDAEVIHYPNLRALYERAAISRGLEGLDARARRYAEELRVETDVIRSRQQSIAQGSIALIALVVGALQIRSAVPWYLGIPLALALVLLAVRLWPRLASFAARLRGTVAHSRRRFGRRTQGDSALEGSSEGRRRT